MQLKGKVALISGAGSGIGKECAKKLASDGASVIITDINLQSAQQTANEIASNQAIGLLMDVTSEDSVQAAFLAAEKHFGGIDILLSNAGIQVVHPFEEFPFEDWKKMLAIHADGAFLTARAAYASMKKRKGGKIIFMGSVHSHLASSLKAPYCFAKHGILGLARVIAKEGAEFNIHSYVVCPGFVRTPLAEKQIPEQAKIKGITQEEVIKNIMLKDTIDGEFTSFEEVANLVSYFALDTNGALSGQSVLVSHGWGMN